MIGSKMKKFRRGKDWTQKKLSEESGISASYIGQLELDNCHPERRKLTKLCQTLELSSEEMDEIFFEAGYRPISLSAPPNGNSSWLTAGLGASGKSEDYSVVPEVLRPLGPFETSDKKFSITIWQEPRSPKKFLLIQDLAYKGEGEAEKQKGVRNRNVFLISNSPDKQLVAQGEITDGYLALSVDVDIKFPLTWEIKIDEEISKGEAP